jgi:LysM repeat protein
MKLWNLFILFTMLIMSFNLFAITHSVQKGDNLQKISNQYHVSIQALQEANHLNGTLIKAGQKLNIPNPGEEQKSPAPVSKVSTKEPEPINVPIAKKEVSIKPEVKEQPAETPIQSASNGRSIEQLKVIQKQVENVDTAYTPATAQSDQIYNKEINTKKHNIFKIGRLGRTGIMAAMVLIIILSLIIIYIAMVKSFKPILSDMKSDILRRIPANLSNETYKPSKSIVVEFDRRFEKLEKLLMSHERNLATLISSLILTAESGKIETLKPLNEQPVQTIPVRIIREGVVETDDAYQCYLDLSQKEDHFECYLCSFVKSPLPELNNILSTVFSLEDRKLTEYQVILPAMFKKNEPVENQKDSWYLIRKGLIAY